MKVLHVNQTGQPVGGTEVYLLKLLEAVEARGIRTVLVHEHGERPTPGRPAYRVDGLAGLDRHGAAAARRVGEILDAERPDVVHLHSLGASAVVDLCRARVPTVRTVHDHNDYCPGGGKYLPALGRPCGKAFGPLCLGVGMATHCTSRRPRALAAAYRRTAAMASATRRLPLVIAASRYVRDRLTQNGFAAEAVRVVPHFASAAPLTEAPGGEGVLFVGRVVPQKGLDLLLQSLHRARPDARLVVAGDGPDLGRARRLAQSLGVESRVRFAGWVDEGALADLYRRADVVAVPSRWPEPFGLVGLEAMSHGKPVVAFDVGGIGEWLEDLRTGFLVPPHDCALLARRIDELLGDPDRARALGAGGRARALQEFGEAAHVDRLLASYAEVGAG